MITHEEFIAKYNGKFLEVGGSPVALNQCVDCANGYIKEVLCQPIILGTNAQDFPLKCLPPVYEYIKNTPTGVPQEGDIMIWSSADRIGHIGIFVSGDSNGFKSFDQNWPLKTPCHTVSHTYTSSTHNVTGWLRCKIKPVIILEPNMTDNEKKMLEFIQQNSITEGQLREGYGYVKAGTVAEKDKQIQTLQSRVLSLEKDSKDLADRLTALESNIEADLKLITDWQSKYESANKSLVTANKSNIEMIAEKNKYKGYYETKCDEIKLLDKMSAWEHIKYGITLLTNKK